MKCNIVIHILCLYVFIIAATACSSPVGNNTPINGTVDLQGHRGARGLRPENTIPAFIFCIENNMSTIELDTCLTADRELIVNHDTELDGTRCLDQSGQPIESIVVMHQTVDQLKRLDCGSLKNEKFPEQVPVPGTKLITLKEFFVFIKEYEKTNSRSSLVRFNIEMKFPDENVTKNIIKTTAQTMLTTVEEAGLLKRTTIQSFNLDALKEIKKRNSKAKTSALFTITHFQCIKMLIGFDSIRDTIIEQALDCRAETISPYYLYVNNEFVEKCHRHRLKVLPWTVNEEDTMSDLLFLGVDGIISDYPDRLYRVYSNWCSTR